jgi:hypothetical protein
MSDRAAAPGPYDEQDVDLASAWERIKLRWWLPAAGVILGAIVGLALALSGGSFYRAATIVYLGQPFAPLGGGQIQSLATNPKTVSEIIRSESVLQDLSDETGIPVAKLRSSISTRELREEGQLRGINPLIEIAVKGDATPGKIEDAADGLAARVVDNVSVFVADKVELLEQQMATTTVQLEETIERIQSAQEQQAAILENQSLSLEQRLLVTANLNTVITTADTRRAVLQEDLSEARQLLNLAEQVESSRVVVPSAAVKTTARSRRTSLIVGALIGLVIGVVAALAAEPIAARRRRGASASAPA